jgi:hypothetical protein
MNDPPDDRARVLAKEALAQIKSLEEIAKFCGEDATQSQELTISLALRNYFIEKTEALHRKQGAQ